MEAKPPDTHCLIAAVDGCIREAQACGLPEAAALLRMAKMDILTRANGISEDELNLLLFALESELRIAEYIAPPELAARRKMEQLADHAS